MNEMIARVIEGWSTYTVRQLGSKFYICKNTGTNAPPLIPDLDMKEAIDRCREMNAVEAIKAFPAVRIITLLGQIDSLFTGYSVTGEGPEKPGERIVCLSDIRNLKNELSEAIK